MILTVAIPKHYLMTSMAFFTFFWIFIRI